MGGFPHHEFFIQLRYTNFVLDVAGGSTDEDNANQKWVYNDGQITNVKSGQVLTAESFGRNVPFVQRHAAGQDTQRYDFYDYTISTKEDEDIVVGLVGAAEAGVRPALIKRDNDSELQQWDLTEN
ncbi:hypothetical protein BGW38_007756 [Lunasporangiospora selenospora]|uniref:Ricin B lectin domain-containing protein n=1 Tax=Lunasporangiospora selenospora TaxID=979761 RepID=A0A9P6FYD6_9FUNG|nr:hypothetical protein BGW38_007756 [Lunasporangiospora selenospora]